MNLDSVISNVAIIFDFQVTIKEEDRGRGFEGLRRKDSRIRRFKKTGFEDLRV
jgi:hypothetical protein